jgi:hypothetical protein
MSYDQKSCEEVKDEVQKDLPRGWEVRCGPDGTKYYDTVNKVENTTYPFHDAVLLPEIVNGCPALNWDHVKYVLQIGRDNALHLQSPHFFTDILVKRTPEDIIRKLKTVTISQWSKFYSDLKSKNKINETLELANVDQYMRCLLANIQGGRRRRQTKRRKQKRGSTKRRNRR